MNTIIPNMDLSYATSDIYYANSGGLFRPDYDYLLGELQILQKSQHLEQAYKDNVLKPFIDYLTLVLGKGHFDRIFSKHKEDLTPDDRKVKSILSALAEALLQRNHDKRYYQSAHRDLLAFQAVVNTIHNLSIERKATAQLPPLVVWSKDYKGPCTFTAAKVEKAITIPIGVVSLPPKYRNGGLFAWSVMGHEVAGHNFLQSKPALLAEINQKFKNEFSGMLKSKVSQMDPSHIALLSKYWSVRQRIEELASDILGILSAGPSLAIGCIGYFRGTSKDGLLKSTGPLRGSKKSGSLHIYDKDKLSLKIDHLSKKVEVSREKGILGKSNPGAKEVHFKFQKTLSDPHPISILRPFAMIEAINRSKLNKEYKKTWSELIEKEINSKEFSKKRNIKIIKKDQKEEEIPHKVAIASAKVAAEIILTTKFSALGNRQITDIFNWSMNDEAIVRFVGKSFHSDKQKNTLNRASAKHIVAAAVIESAKKGANIEQIFKKMKGYLLQMQDRR